jgi:hypothetical protein
MAGMKVTVDAALRARDVSRPTPAQEALAEQALPERLASRRSGPEPQAAPAAVSQPPDNRSGRPRPVPGPARPRRPTRPATGRDDRADGADAAAPPAARAEDEAQDLRLRVRRRARLARPSGQGSPDQGRGGSSPDFS